MVAGAEVSTYEFEWKNCMTDMYLESGKATVVTIREASSLRNVLNVYIWTGQASKTYARMELVNSRETRYFHAFLWCAMGFSC